jgi:xeroderma pigmentosum group C-complementing protein
MAPRRGQVKSPANTPGPRRSNRNASSRRKETTSYGNLPDVYQSLIADADADLEPISEERPIKRRKVTPIAKTLQAVNTSETLQQSSPSHSSHSKIDAIVPPSNSQTIEDSSESEGSDVEFEDVALSLRDESESESDREQVIEDVSISLEPESTPKPRKPSKRKLVSSVDKAHRLLVHKLHVLCLLGHCMFVNGRCNNAVVQKHLRALLPPRALPFLNPDPHKTQYQRNSMFMDGLQQAVAAFTGRFRITAPGLKKPVWQFGDEGNDEHGELAGRVDFDDFISAAKSLSGSQDTGNQLFCAMLRSVGVNARIICSLQVLPFGSVPKTSTPQKVVKPRHLAMASNQRFSLDVSNDDSSVMASSSLGRLSAIRRRLGQPSMNSVATPIPSSHKRSKSVPKLSYPVFWVEAFNPSYSKWIVVDPLVTNTVNVPSGIEPPLSYSLNQMTYVMAFEADGVVRDITRRYAKSYNAKTRRQRVEAAGESGVLWWKRTLRIFRRLDGRLDRDQIEDAEMAQKEAREGLPANVLDFKGHPYYALERHLKRNEVIHPKREVGRVNAGTAKKPRMESVYRRNDVLICRSADKWYRAGREIKPDEHPLKYVRARTRRDQTPDQNAADPADPATTGLYAFFQTTLYVPPPVREGRVPRNAYGNLDIYTPSMIPAGGTHVRDAQAGRAALLLRIDYADAVTGFSFKGRHGTAVIEGVIVATEHADAVHALIESFREDAIEEASRARSLEALRLWKRFVVGLRITERVNAYGGITRDQTDEDPSHINGNNDEGVDQDVTGGGFLSNGSEEEPMPTAGRFSLSELSKSSKTAKGKQKARKKKHDDDLHDEDADDKHDQQYDGSSENGLDNTTRVDNLDDAAGGGSLPEDAYVDDSVMGGGFLPEGASFHDPVSGCGFLPENEDADNDVMGGGFVPDDADDNTTGGGFLLDDADDLKHDSAENDVQVPRAEEHSDLPADRAELGHQDNGSQAASSNPLDEVVASPSPPDLGNTGHVVAYIIEPSDAVSMPDALSSPVASKADLDQGYSQSSLPLEKRQSEDEDSIMSHDPEDEDAEPDWLESD